MGQTPGEFVTNDTFARTVSIETLLNSPREIILYLTAVPQCICLVSGLFFFTPSLSCSVSYMPVHAFLTTETDAVA